MKSDPLYQRRSTCRPQVAALIPPDRPATADTLGGVLGWFRAGVLALVAVAVVMSGCKGCHSISSGGDNRPALGKVVVKRLPDATVQGTAISLDDAPIVAKAKEVLEASGFFVVAEGSRQKQNIVNVGIDVEALADGGLVESEIGVKLHLKVDIHPTTPDMARYGDDSAALGQAPLDKAQASDPSAAFQRLVERTTQDLLTAYVGRQKLWTADESEIIKVLASADNDLRLEAIRVTGLRKLRSQLPTLLRLLTDEDEGTRDAALGAVVAMGDRGAIKALAESRQMRDSYEMSKVLDAVASLGGEEAKDYLSFVGETHDDSQIRSMAKAAFERLKKRDVIPAPTR